MVEGSNQHLILEMEGIILGPKFNFPFQLGETPIVNLTEHPAGICACVRVCVSPCRTDSERVLHQRVHAVPFHLAGSEEAVVRVLSPLEASALNMEVIHEKFHQATYGFSDIIGQYLSGEKPKGQLETEEMLKVGLTVGFTVVGAVYKGIQLLPLFPLTGY